MSSNPVQFATQARPVKELIKPDPAFKIAKIGGDRHLNEVRKRDVTNGFRYRWIKSDMEFPWSQLSRVARP